MLFELGLLQSEPTSGSNPRKKVMHLLERGLVRWSQSLNSEGGSHWPKADANRSTLYSLLVL